MAERITLTVNQEPRIEEVLGVHKLTWSIEGREFEVCTGVATNKKQLSEHLFLIGRLNGSHPLKIVELEDAYLPISASESIEVYDSPQNSDSETSEMEYLARERQQPRRFYIQQAKYGFVASIHEHEEGSGVWERYDWIRGKLGLLLPNQGRRIVDENSRQVVIPGKLKHQAVGMSEQSSVTIITTTARQHIHSTFL